jgi:hypothetical protein
MFAPRPATPGSGAAAAGTANTPNPPPPATPAPERTRPGREPLLLDPKVHGKAGDGEEAAALGEASAADDQDTALEVIRRPRRRMMMIGVGAGAGIAVAILLGLVLRAPKEGSSVAQSAAVTPSSPRPGEQAPVTPVPRKTRWVLIDTEPSGADVIRDGKRIGDTPESLELPADEEIAIDLHRDGYKDQRIVIGPSSKREEMVMLVKATGGEAHPHEAVPSSSRREKPTSPSRPVEPSRPSGKPAIKGPPAKDPSLPPPSHELKDPY